MSQHSLLQFLWLDTELCSSQNGLDNDSIASLRNIIILKKVLVGYMQNDIQLKLGQYLSNICLETFSIQKVKKCIFKGHKHPAETSTSRAGFIFPFHLTNRKTLYLKLNPTLSRQRSNPERVTPNSRGKRCCLQGTLRLPQLLRSSCNTLCQKITSHPETLTVCTDPLIF